MTLYLLQYNNYYNRLLKKKDTLDEYSDFIVDSIQVTNFSARDGLSTSHIINTEETGDYALIVDDSGEIVSRWYILEAVRIRKGQYNLTLFRDVIADWWDEIVVSPMFVEKGWLAADDPAIFNSENMNFNQIKTRETLLRDESYVPWIVGYYAKDATDINGAVSTNSLESLGAIQLSTSIEAWELAQYSTSTPFITPYTNGKIGIKARQDDGISGTELIIALDPQTVTSNKSNQYNRETLRMNYQVSMVAAYQAEAVANGVAAVSYATLSSQLPDYVTTNTNAEFSELMSYDGALVRDINGKFFRVVVSEFRNTTKSVPISAGSLYQSLYAVVANSNSDGIAFFLNTPDNTSFVGYGDVVEYVVSLKRESRYETTYDITGTENRIITTDATYNIFAIPFGELEVRAPFSDETICTTSAEIAMAIATEIQRAHQSKIYDVQILPYCPVPELIHRGDGSMIAPGGGYYSTIRASDQIVGIIYNVPNAKFELNLNAPNYTTAAAKTSIDRKINNECDFYRLASPNYSNYFDFSAEKNNGVKYFNVDCEYKPYTPYIHVNPNFGGLYGKDFNDARGLILGGDFSLAQVGNAWEQYKIQNKNFQETFDRQIQNMEVNNNMARISETVGMITGTMQGAATGAMAGAMTGTGPIGAVVGGAVGGVASLAGGIADMTLNEQLRNEAMDYTKDLFGYNLQNIQALPQTISKISAFNPNNKLFPIVEYYTCTDTEKEALRNKIIYNGMTIMRIGTLENYLNTNSEVPHYYKGQLIRIEGTKEDAHIAQAIANELNKGVYI